MKQTTLVPFVQRRRSFEDADKAVSSDESSSAATPIVIDGSPEKAKLMHDRITRIQQRRKSKRKQSCGRGNIFRQMMGQEPSSNTNNNSPTTTTLTAFASTAEQQQQHEQQQRTSRTGDSKKNVIVISEEEEKVLTVGGDSENNAETAMNENDSNKTTTTTLSAIAAADSNPSAADMELVVDDVAANNRPDKIGTGEVQEGDKLGAITDPGKSDKKNSTKNITNDEIDADDADDSDSEFFDESPTHSNPKLRNLLLNLLLLLKPHQRNHSYRAMKLLNKNKLMVSLYIHVWRKENRCRRKMPQHL